MSRIRVDYDNARRQAKRLSQIENDCYQIANMIEKLKAETTSVWEGTSADVFRLALEKRSVEIRKISKNAKELSVWIMQAVKNLEEAEKRVEDSVNAINTSFTGTRGGQGGGGGGGRGF